MTRSLPSLRPAAALVAPAVAAALMAAVLAGCSPSAEELGPGTTRVGLTFTDASVPPEDHRSWQLLLQPDGPLATVTDYEEVVYEDLAAMPEDEWAELVDDLPGLIDELDAAADDDPDDCAGGTTLLVEVFEHTAPQGDPAAAENELVQEVEVGSCADGGADAIEETLVAVTDVAAPTGLPEQARSWPIPIAG